jgi:succinylglutamic semialdehyde dehydrogenase
MLSHFIENTWLEGTGPRFASLDPATGQSLGDYHAATGEEVDQAVRAARGAFESWSLRSIDDRISYLNAFAELLKKEKTSTAPSALARLISQEMGKPLWESLTELDAMINKIPISIQAMKDRRSPSE